MNPRQVNRDLFRRSAFADQRKVHLRSVGTDVFRTDLCIFSKTVSQNRFGDLGQDGTNVFTFNAHDSASVERQSLNKVRECLSQISEVVPIGIHVVFIDVGDDRDDRRQIQEGSVRLVGFGHNVKTLSEFGVGARCI